MQRTTQSSYPNLVPVTPINGVIYKAKSPNRPHPRLVAMPIKEIIKHEKREAVVAAMFEESPKNSIFRSKRKKNKRTNKSEVSDQSTATLAPEHTEELLDFEAALKSLEDHGPPGHEEKKETTSLRRLKSVLKKSLRHILPAPTYQPNPTIPQMPPIKNGFHCRQDGCSSCTPNPTNTPCRPSAVRALYEFSQRHNGLLSTNALQSFRLPSSFCSGFSDISTTSNSSSATLSPVTVDLDVFQGFEGVHIEPTPPQLGDVRLGEGFMETVKGWVGDWTDTDEEEGLDDTSITVPDTYGSGEREKEAKCPGTPVVSSTSVRDGEGKQNEDPETPCPKSKGKKIEGGKTLSFFGNMGDKELEVLLSSGTLAQGRRRSARC